MAHANRRLVLPKDVWYVAGCRREVSAAHYPTLVVTAQTVGLCTDRATDGGASPARCTRVHAKATSSSTQGAGTRSCPQRRAAETHAPMTLIDELRCDCVCRQVHQAIAE